MDHPGQGRAVPLVEASATSSVAEAPLAPRRHGVEPGAERWPVAPSAGSRAKRTLDLAVTLAVLPLAGLLVGALAVLVVVTSRGPAFFVQERVGRGGQRFRMVKFRTMVVDAEARLRQDPKLWAEYVTNHYKLPATSDPRVTRIGRFLRRSSLDELPQLLNVLRGHMSLVGPRPIVPDELTMYGEHPEVYLGVKPGLTGWWQVNGRSGVGYPTRVDLDRAYAERWTLALDVKILLRTPLTVLRARGAH
jgi:exopolysaccharide production protein ExoY